MIARIMITSVVMFIERTYSLSASERPVKTYQDAYEPGKVASQHSWKDIAHVYNYLWGFPTWCYRFSLLTYCTMVLRELPRSTLICGGNRAVQRNYHVKRNQRTIIGSSLNFNPCSCLNVSDHGDGLPNS
jgi:hypothetical protein